MHGQIERAVESSEKRLSSSSDGISVWPRDERWVALLHIEDILKFAEYGWRVWSVERMR